MYGSISFYDGQALLGLLETVAWVVFLAVVLSVFVKIKTVSKQNRQILILLFVAWALVSVCRGFLEVYNYFENQRPMIVESIETRDKYNDIE